MTRGKIDRLRVVNYLLIIALQLQEIATTHTNIEYIVEAWC